MGLKLKIKRLEKGIKQKDLAAELGISKQYLSHLETGKATNPNRDLMISIARILGATVQELFFEE